MVSLLEWKIFFNLKRESKYFYTNFVSNKIQMLECGVLKQTEFHSKIYLLQYCRRDEGLF